MVGQVNAVLLLENVGVVNMSQGLWDNIHAKRKRIAAGSGERMRKPGSAGAPTAKNFKDARKTATKGKSK